MWMVVAQISMQYMSQRGLSLVMSGKSALHLEPLFDFTGPLGSLI